MTVDSNTPGNIARFAKNLAMRIRWEMEHGKQAYSPSPVSISHNGSVPDERRSDKTTARPNFTEKPGGITQVIALPESSPSSKKPPYDGLEQLRNEIGDCTRCRLAQTRTHLVFGEGSAHARLVFVGEGPGRDEDLSGRPFVGAAGQLLDKIIAAIGLKRDEVYICNVVKCRPPNNRTPREDECDICGSFVKKQLAIIHPEVVVPLGGTAAKFLLGVDRPVGSLRGNFHKIDDLSFMPTYHPSYLLRSPQAKRPVWEDMQMVAVALGLTVPNSSNRKRG
jgi:uracil-DNA glycosylase family 4